MIHRYGVAEPQTAELIESVGMVADRLLAACTSDAQTAGIGTKTLLESALIVAADAQQQLTAQSERIAALEALSFTDELTGLYNRRGFNEQLRRTLAIAERHGSTGVLAFIDLDDFKAINDGLGHQAGDAVLCHVANLLSENVRATDVVARLGGDEFAVILVHTSAREGRQRAAVLDRMLNAAVVSCRSYEIPVRASFGAKPYGSGDEPDALLARADAAMYRNKRNKPRVLHPWRQRLT